MYIEQAQSGKNNWWRVLIVAGPIMALFAVNILLFLMLSPGELSALMQSANFSDNKNINLVNNLFPFVLLLGYLLLFFVLLHKRSLISLTTARDRIDFKRIGFSVLLTLSIQLASFFISYAFDNSEILWNFNPIQFSVLLIISLVLLPIQIGFEEYFFRGYLMQQIGLISRSLWVPLIFTSVFFGLVHSANPEVSEMGFKMMIFYIGTGFFMGLMTLLDDGLELSLGFHFANNFIASILITADFSALQTDALFRYSGVSSSESLFSETLITMLITYPILLFVFSKKYRWSWNKINPLKSKL